MFEQTTSFNISVLISMH